MKKRRKEKERKRKRKKKQKRKKNIPCQSRSSSICFHHNDVIHTTCATSNPPLSKSPTVCVVLPEAAVSLISIEEEAGTRWRCRALTR